MTTTGPWARDSDAPARVTNVELFFDLVYVFAVTQLSHYLLAHLSVVGALQTVLLLGMVWLAWVYTTWVTNWLDPDQIPVRVMLLVLTLISLVLAFALPEAFAGRGLTVGIAYAVSQIGRSVFAVAGLRGALQRSFERILCWVAVTGALAVTGGLVHGHARAFCWILVVVIDLLGGWAGYWTPGLGRSATSDWTLDGGHFAERCQAFLLIALGESVVLIGGTLSQVESVSTEQATAFVLAFLGAAAFWWLYFDRTAREGMVVIGHSADPGRLGRSAYHFIHPIMIAGIIATAAADEVLLSHPGVDAEPSTAWLILGGTALYLAGLAAFKVVVWRVVPWSRLVAIFALALIGVLATSVTALVLAGLTTAVLLAVIAADRVAQRTPAAA